MERDRTARYAERKTVQALLDAAGAEFEALPVSLLDGPFVLSSLVARGKEEHPLVFASASFCELTGYKREEILGRNCRFLQGPDTDPEDVRRVRELIREEQEGVVRLLNYTKGGVPFVNTLLMAPIRNADGKTVLFFGGQCEEVAQFERDCEKTAQNISQVSNVALKVGRRVVVPNAASEGISFKTEWAKGRVLLKTRTDRLSPEVKEVFAKNSNQFVFQLQIALIRPLPDDWQVFIGAEIELSELQFIEGGKFACDTMVKCLRLFDSSLHCSYGAPSEKPHFAYPFNKFGDTMVRTLAGDEPPTMTKNGAGSGVPRRSEFEKVEMGYVYTTSFSSQLLDLEAWKVLRIPGMRNLALESFWGESPLHFVVYALPKEESEAVHNVSKRLVLLDVEVIHRTLKMFPQRTSSLDAWGLTKSRDSSSSGSLFYVTSSGSDK